MGTQGTGRKRSTKKERSTAEDDALNLIAREAEARLAAKRAARAEAREIRMKELERQQKEIFQVQKKYYGLNTKVDDRSDSKWGDIEQWMEESERYSRSSVTQTLSDEDERMSVGSRGSVRSDLDAVGAFAGGGSSSNLSKKSKKKKKHKHKDKDRNGYDDDYSVISSRSSRLSDESRVSRSSRLDLTSSRLSDDSRLTRGSRLDLQPASYASSDLYKLNGLSSSRNPGSTLNGYKSSLYEDSLCSGSRRVAGSTSHPVEYSSYRSSGSRVSSRANSARTSPVDNCGSVASFLRSAASSSGLPRDLDDVTIPDFSDVSRFAPEGRRGSRDVEDRDYLEKGSRAASALTAGTLTSLGGSSSRRGSGETAITVDAETSLREIKEIHELKDQIQDVETKYTQNLKEVKDTLAEVEEKYRKAMVSNAQLDNEKNNLMYQVDTLKDSLMELEELLSESRRGYDEKVKDFEREKHAHSVLQFQFNEMKETLKQSEELLNEIRQLRMKQEGFVREISDLQETVEWKDKKIGALERQKEYTDAIRIERDELREEVVTLKDILKKHGIVLGPDLNINGDIGETQVDGSPSEDPSSPSAQDSQTPAEGNSMLGNTKETQLRTRGDEDVDLEQHQDMFEEVKVNPLGSDTVCNTAQESVCSKRDIKVKESKTAVVGDMAKTSNQVTDNTQDKQKNNVEECNLTNTESCPQQKITQDVTKENCPDESVPSLPNSEPQQEQDDTKKVDNDEEEEMPSQAQGAAASGKKKKKKRKGKKKVGNNEDNNQPKEKGKTEKGMQPATKDNGPINARFCCWPVTETLKELKGNQVKNKQDKQKQKDVAGGVQVVKPVEAVHSNDISKESQMDPVTDEHCKEQTLETEKLKEVEALASCGSIEAPQGNEQDSLETETTKTVPVTATTETFPHADILKETEADSGKESETDPEKESETDPEKNEQGEEQKLEEKVEEMRSRTSPVPESNLSTPDTGEISSDAEITEDDAKDCTSSVENSEMLNVTETENIEEVKEIDTGETIEARADHDTDEKNKDQNLDSEMVNPVEAVAAIETFSHEEYPSKESRRDSIKDEDDMEQALETSEVEEESTFNPGSETSFSTSDLEDSINAESIEYPAKRCTSSEGNSDIEISTNSSVIHTESEAVDSAESEVGSINEIKSETNDEENGEGDAHVPGHSDAAPDESESTNSPDSGSMVYSTSTDGLYDGLYDGQQSLSESEQPSELLSETADMDSCSDNTPIDISERDSEDETQTVVEYEGPETEGESPPPTLDAGHSELVPDRTEEEELNGDLREAEGLVEPDSSPNDKINDASDTEESPLEAVVQSEGLDEEQNKTSEFAELTDESHAELSSATEEINTIDMLDSPDSPKEGTEISSSIKQDHNTEESVVEEDPERTDIDDDQQSETPFCPLMEQRHEPLKDKSEDYQRSEVSSELTLLDSDDEGDVDEEGQSFDFDELEMEDAVAMNLSEDPKQIAIVEGVEILSKESHKGSLDLSQSNIDLMENTDPGEGGHRVDKRHEESDAVSQDTQNSWVHGDASSENLVEEQVNILEEVGVTEEPRRVTEKGKVLKVGVVSEKLNQATSLPLEEGLDAVQHELKEEDSVSLKSWDLVSSNTESVQTGRNSRKGSKKGKGKGKEDCKMS
ncbi:myb-like protein X isoform X3 [Labrus bergylta]|uniref:myb-like protein X isoform X3 n=1 Tax=Labrus bergylta TaxID=56723 RepID=UPI003314329C